MESKQELVGLIKEWISCDNKIKQCQKTAKELREEKKSLTETLVTVMKSNEIDCFDCNSGKITYTKSNVKKAISKKYLTDVLNKFYGEENSNHAEELRNFILENRQIEVKENIKLKRTNN